LPIQDSAFLALGQGYLPPWAGYACAGLAAAGWAWSRLRSRAARRRHGLPVPGMARALLAWALPAAGAFALAAVCNADRGVPVSVLAMALAAFSGHALAMRTRFGRHVFAIGSNREAARYA